MSGWGKRRSQRPDPGQEYKADDSLFDVVAWREDTTQDLVDIKDQVKTEGDETQAKLDVLEASLTSIESTIVTESNETQSALSDINTELDVHTTQNTSSFSELQDINTELDAQTALLQEIAGDTGGDASTATLTQVTLANTASTNLKTASTDFVSFIVSNESVEDIWIKFQDEAVDAVKKGIFLERGGYYEMPTGQRYTGAISAIADSGTPVVNVVYY